MTMILGRQPWNQKGKTVFLAKAVAFCVARGKSATGLIRRAGGSILSRHLWRMRMPPASRELLLADLETMTMAQNRRRRGLVTYRALFRESPTQRPGGYLAR